MADKKSLQSYEHCCRTCLNEETTFDIFTETLNATNLADILISCTQLKIQKEDFLSKRMCSCCYNCLVSFYNFRELALKIDARQRESIPNNIPVNSYDTNQSNEYPFGIKIENDIVVDYNTNDEFSNSQCQPKVEINDNQLLVENENLDLYTDTGITNDEFSNSQCQPKVEINDNELLVENENLDLYTDTGITQDVIKFTKPKKKEKIECDYCSKRFRKLSTLQHHLKKHNILKDYDDNSSQEPNNELAAYSLDEDNIVNETNDISNESFTCGICALQFRSTNSLSAHMRAHAEKGRVISCAICGKVFKKISHLKRHKIVHDTNRYYKCSVCSRSFQSKEVLEGHMNKHNGIKPHNCPLCSKSFAHLTTLKSHIKMHNKDKFLCPTCGKKYDSSTSLDQHVKRHLGLKQFQCTLCPKKFVSKGELKSHTITHTGEKSYTCSECGARFTKQSSLRKHKLRHLGIKPFQCETCSMKFTSKDHLKRHNRTHTGEKPYKCDICARAFTQSNDLLKHRRAHLGEKIYKCTECSESFRLHAELRQHLSDHYISSQLQLLNKNNENNTEGIKETNIDIIESVQTDNNKTNK